MNKNKNIFFKIYTRLFKRFRPYYSYFDYYENIIDQINFDSLITKISNQNINDVNTQNEITFYSFPFCQHVNQIIKKIGAPRYKIKSKQISGFVTYFYRKKLSNMKITVVMHFLDERLMMGSYILDSFQQEFSKQLEYQIINKYFSGAVNSTIPVTVTDSNFNKIEIIHSVDYRINFISGNKIILNTLNKLKKEQQNLVNEKVKLAFDNFI